MTTVDRIFRLINENNVTAKEFANIVGLSPGNITDWKTGRAKPSTEALIKISNVYGVSVDYLLCKSNLKVPLSQYTQYVIFNFKSYILSKYNNAIINLGLSENELSRFMNCLNSIFEFYTYQNDVFETYFESVRNKNDILKVFKLVLTTFYEMYAYSLKYVPLAENTSTRIVNFYEDFQMDISDFSLDEQDFIYVENIMKKVNDLFIDGPIYKRFTKPNTQISSTLYNIPVYGQISAGQPNWAEECLEGYLPIDPNLMNIVDPEECFFLRVNGESMNKLIRNGAYALIRKQDIVENGEIAVVLVNSYDATLKKFTRQNDLIILEPMSNDPNFTTQVYAKDTEIKILGKYIGKFEMNS